MDNNTIELLCRLPRAAGLQQLCDLAYEILGNPVFISDLTHNILAYTKSVEVEDAIWQENVVQSRLDSRTLRQEREVGALHGGSARANRAVLVRDSHMPYPRYIKTLVRGGQPVGVMVTTAYLRPFEAGDEDLIELIAAFMLPKTLDAHNRAVGKRQSVESFLLKLLDGSELAPALVRKRLEELGFTPRAHMYVLVIGQGHEEGGQAVKDMGRLLEEFLAVSSCRAMFYNTSVVCVFDSDGEVTDWAAWSQEMAELLRRENLFAGVSRTVGEPAALQKYYRQALEALEIGLRLQRQERFYTYDSVSSFALFRSVPEEELMLYCHQKIQRLGAYDETHGTELCVTLQVYLEQAKSLARTADILFIHRNTVRYRIKKCMEFMNTGLEDGNEIFAFILSLRILEYKRKFLRAAPGRPAEELGGSQ